VPIRDKEEVARRVIRLVSIRSSIPKKPVRTSAARKRMCAITVDASTSSRDGLGSVD